MPNRDYAARSKSRKSNNKWLIVIIILLLLLLSGLGLWFLTQTGSNSPVQPMSVKSKEISKSQLPSRPEETYSYIRELETREVPVDKNSRIAKLTAEQEKQIKRQQEAERQRLEQQATHQLAEAETAVTVKEPSLEDREIKKAQEQKILEERNKQAELEKQKAIQQAQQKKAPPAKIVATAKPASEATKSQGKYGLQCGAFKSKAQAENMQARLAMAGYNARINTSAEWNRVVVGPVGDRAAASAAQSNARSVAECLIIGM